MVSVSAELLGVLQIVAQQGLVVGVSHLDECLSLLHVALVAQVGHSVLRYHGVDEVVGVVDVAGKGNDAGYCAALGSGAAGEDAQVGIVGEVG